MSRLISVAQVSMDGSPDAATVLLQSAKINAVDVANTTGAQLKYERYYNKEHHNIVTSTSAVDVTTAINAANTTNNSVRELVLTQKNADGTTTTRRVSTEQIDNVRDWPTDSNDAMVTIEYPNDGYIEVIRVDETRAAILSAANA